MFRCAPTATLVRMKNVLSILAAALLLGLAACQSPVGAAAGRPELRYYIIGDS